MILPIRMGKIIFILGGARSGKSTYAVKLAKRLDQKIAFIATCLPLDKEMRKRIKIHKKNRPSRWQTFEAGEDIATLLKDVGPKFNTLIIDCLTLFISGLLSIGLDDKVIEERVNKMLEILKSKKCKSIIVSNEVGLGIVPKNRLGRRFRDLAGRINQIVAEKSDEVFFLVSGIPWRIK